MAMCVSGHNYLCLFVINTCRLKTLLFSVCGGVDDMLHTANLLLDLTHFCSYVFKNLETK